MFTTVLTERYDRGEAMRFVLNHPICQTETITVQFEKNTPMSTGKTMLIGDLGVLIIHKVLNVHGILYVTIRHKELIVGKEPDVEWDMLLPSIYEIMRYSFKRVRGLDISIIPDSRRQKIADEEDSDDCYSLKGFCKLFMQDIHSMIFTFKHLSSIVKMRMYIERKIQMYYTCDVNFIDWEMGDDGRKDLFNHVTHFQYGERYEVVINMNSLRERYKHSLAAGNDWRPVADWMVDNVKLSLDTRERCNGF